MASPDRIYLVKMDGAPARLVRGTSRSQARNPVVRDRVSVKVANQDEIVALLSAQPPARVEDARADEADAESDD